ncbi:MAG: hypothetical protein K9M96_18655 [Deltaproteobacteria bacterium]|nr:hypothetical protein [Deltaproteobacteria bacterium]
MKIQESIARHIKTRLDDCKALLISEPEGLYQDLVTGLASEEITVVDGEKSTILRREAVQHML